ncbi:uncharacterized protein [Choristoneura fumiferana]|uniref:uncharacterized protein n=1 Tax=Choristoneura fumiferana TaxID=7141 RepID=UPI003D15DAF9
MAEDDAGAKCKQRFKGIENFLRKVAYNLGNSPSQTEVKIISCIPIDVTDLQQKIIHLERQLEVATSCKKQVMCVQHATCGYTPPACHDSHGGDDTCPASKKSAVSFACAEPCGQYSSPCEPAPRCCSATKRKLFKKKKKSVVCYYAQTTASPFSNYERLSAKQETQNTDTSLNRPFISTDIIRKQYQDERYLEELAGSSQVSAPVCRDAGAASPTARASDVCSCCHGRFLDLDQDMESYHLLSPTSAHTMPQPVDHSVYYDSSFYDMIPVKEKPDKIKKESERAMRREAKAQLDATYWSKSYKPHPARNPLIMNCILPPPSRYMREPHIRYPKRRDRPIPRTWCKNNFSRNTLVECGDTYIKQPAVEKRRPKTILLKNAECTTFNVNDSECQTESSKSIQQPEATAPEEPLQNKTEVTLNQIKNILQSVLTQVKTNNLVKNQPEERNTKDANVQNEALNNSQDPSRILNSYTYSPFTINPYMAACSPAKPPAECPVPMMHQSMSMPPQGTSLPLSHIQNYPLFIHRTSAKQPPCSSCCHPALRRNKPAQPKQTSTSELPRGDLRSKETESLIKEIYKSVALSINAPTNETSHSDYDDHKPTPPKDGAINESGEPVVSNLVTLSRQVGSSAQKIHTKQTAVSTANPSRETSSTLSAISKPSGDQRSAKHFNLACLRNRKGHEPDVQESDTATTSQGHTLKSCIIEETLSEEEGEEDDESASESEEDSEETIAPASKSTKGSGKKGLLSKMFGSVFKKRRKKEQEEYAPSISADDTETSDSDDYQTVYSEPAEKPSKHVRYAPTQKETSKYEDYHKRYGGRQPQYHQNTDQAPAAARRARPPGIYFQNFEMRPTLFDSSRPEYSQHGQDYTSAQSEGRDTGSLPTTRNVGIKLSKQAKWMKKEFKCGPAWKELAES